MMELYEFFQIIESFVEVIPGEEEMQAAGEKLADVIDLHDHVTQPPPAVRLSAELNATGSSG